MSETIYQKQKAIFNLDLIQPMGAEGQGINLDLGIASSIDPLHLSEVAFFTPEQRTCF